ncbi:AsmA family protein [Jannaschia donghaensis]|uniref:Putative assembly protein n=1 Tax=Jannaschia donghaensis TaxID=420998 RepID=A0A0M6YJQ3_9RHOB|nr:AsmA family protein [Jannaschia donghaensis]CTQ49895.1 putative assembly protein [Jannaschia donghaensis]
MKWLFRILGAVAVVVVLAVVALILVPTERVAALASDRFADATGRALTFDGPVKATLWPHLGVRAEAITVANADWSDEGPMLTADTLEVGIALGGLLGGDVRIETLRVDGAALLLERAADGRANWEFAARTGANTAAAPSGPSDAGNFSIDRAVLNGAKITWLDHGADTRVELRAVDLETRVRDLDSPVRLAGSALLDGQAIKLEMSTEAARPLLDGALTPVALTFTAGETALRLDGRADFDPPSFEGRLEATSSDRFRVARIFDVIVPDLPDGLGRSNIAVKAAVTLAPGKTLHLRDMVIDLDRNRLNGALDIDPNGERPRVVGTLSAQRLDLTSLSQKGQGGETALVSETGWGREEIDVTALFALDGELTLSSGPITLGDATLEEVRARVALESGRMVATLQPLLAYGGTVTGDVIVNGRGTPSSRVDLQLSGLQMLPFLTEFADFDRLVGQADVAIDVLGSGTTTQALIDSLNGTASFKFGRGELLGLDIVGMVREMDAGFRGEGQKTVFDGFSGSFAIADGVARNEDLSLTAQYLTARGAGRISLGPQTIRYRVLPTVRRGEDSSGITVPILIEGPWSDPSIRPDLEYMARQRLEGEREEMEAKARAEADAARIRVEQAARAKLAAELDVAPEDLRDRGAVEDAIKERVEEQLLDLLLGR